jgi:hypothetical protein
MALSEMNYTGGGSSNEFYAEYTTSTLPSNGFVECGFKPKTICFATKWNNGTLTYASFTHNGTSRRIFNSNVDTDTLVDSITDTGFYFESTSLPYMTYTMVYATDI